MTAVQANGITIETQCYGPRSGVPLLLVRGLGSQLVHWPHTLIEGFSSAGFRVVVFDNRDSGLSQKWSQCDRFDAGRRVREAAAGRSTALAYTLDDMAADTVGVLDALGMERAHIVGISMGGMIVQHVAARHGHRLRSMTSLMSSSGNPDLPQAVPAVLALLLAEPDQPCDRASVIAHTLACDRVWGSPGYPFDDMQRGALIGRAFDRCYCPEGVARQWAAVQADGSRLVALAAITVPALIVHGTDDALLPLAHGEDTAARIAGAEFLAVPGMGHDLEGELSRIVVDAVVRHACAADCKRTTG